MIPPSSFPDEEWRPIPGYEGRYLVSSYGNVFSIKRKWARGGMLKPMVDRIDYYFMVRLSIDGHQRCICVHSLVTAAFIGPKPDGVWVRHLDGNSKNNHISNLAYGTPSENVLDAVRHGTHGRVQVTHCPKGHSYTKENTRVSNGSRICRECGRQDNRERRKRQKLAATE